MTLKIKQFVVDKKGRPQAVVLPWSSYRKLVDYVGDLEDSMALKRAIKTNHGFISHDMLVKKLQRSGRL